MIKTLIIDDEPLARELISELLKSHTEFEVIGMAKDGFDGFKLINELKPDLIFLDIQMPRLSGFEMLELLEKRPDIIFTTAHSEFALQAFDEHAIDYLLKPISRIRFDEGIAKYLKNKNSVKPDHDLTELYNEFQERLVVKDHQKIRIIPVDTIQYLEANDDYINIYCESGKFLKKFTMTALEKLLDPKDFIRVHRSYIVPVSQLLRIEQYEREGLLAILACGAKVNVSKTGYSRLKDRLNW